MHPSSPAFGLPLPLAVGGLPWALIWGVVGVATYEAVAALGARSPLEATVFVVILVGVLVTIEILTVRRGRRREAAALVDAAPVVAVVAVAPAPVAPAELAFSAEMTPPNTHLDRNVHLDDTAPPEPPHRSDFPPLDANPTPAPAKTPHPITHLTP